MNNCLAIIIARGGSKRIHRKNIKSFLGKSIISYSVDASLKAGCFDEVMVSTDDQEIANLALSFGAKVPFMRSAITSNDYATTADVVVEVLQQYKVLGKVFNYCCCLYPTAPFITAAKLRTGFDKLIKSGAETLVPVVRFSYPIFRSVKILNGLIKMNWPEYNDIRSQDLPESFHDCGQFYFVRTESFLKNPKFFTDFTVPLEMPESEVQDIDNEEDWKLAEIKYTLISDHDRNN